MQKKHTLINVKIPVLDHGFVMLKDFMGTDADIVEAARQSTQGSEKPYDQALLRYLYRQRHTGPFEMAEIKLHCCMPIFVARQWIRHRTANVNEQSGRYGEIPELVYVPDDEHICYQSTGNKQGSAEPVDPDLAENFVQDLKLDAEQTFSNYRRWCGEGIARETARINLPLSTYTQWYWKVDVHNLFNFLALRLDKHAQYEIRAYAEAIAEIAEALWPDAFSAFEDYRLITMQFNGPELHMLADSLSGPSIDEFSPRPTFTAREHAELKDKVRRLGINAVRRMLAFLEQDKG